MRSSCPQPAACLASGLRWLCLGRDPPPAAPVRCRGTPHRAPCLSSKQLSCLLGSSFDHWDPEENAVPVLSSRPA